MTFFTDILNLAKTRKFWVGLGGALLDAAVLWLIDMPEFSPIVKIVTVLGIYQVPNKQ